MNTARLIARFLLVFRKFIFHHFLLTLFCCVPIPALSQTVEWIQQWGAYEHDESIGVSADGLGNVYISGVTRVNEWDPNAFVSMYDASGILLWNKQLGTGIEDYSYSISDDGLGNAYATGTSMGNLEGSSVFDYYAFVSKINASGAILWTKQLGNNMSVQAHGVSTDGLGNVYIAGSTNGSFEEEANNVGGYDAFFSKYDASGTLLWIRQLGTSYDDFCSSVSADGLGNVYISGRTYGNLGGPNAGWDDAFVSKYDASGTLQWTKQLGTSSDDSSYSVSADGLGNVYISGCTSGNLGGSNAGGYDAFVSKYDALGTLIWIKQMGSDGYDSSEGVSVDSFGNVYITGLTEGSLEGENAGGYDAFVSKYDSSGKLLWTQQLGTVGDDISRGVSADAFGNVFFSGYTSGSLGGDNAGYSDAFVVKISDLPEPSTLVGLLGLCLAGLLILNRRKQA